MNGPSYRLLGRAVDPSGFLALSRRYPTVLYRLTPLKRGGWLVFEVRT